MKQVVDSATRRSRSSAQSETRLEFVPSWNVEKQAPRAPLGSGERPQVDQLLLHIHLADPAPTVSARRSRASNAMPRSRGCPAGADVCDPAGGSGASSSPWRGPPPSGSSRSALWSRSPARDGSSQTALRAVVSEDSRWRRARPGRRRAVTTSGLPWRNPVGPTGKSSRPHWGKGVFRSAGGDCGRPRHNVKSRSNSQGRRHCYPTSSPALG